MTNRQVGRVNQQSKGETPLVSGVLQRAAVRALAEEEGEETQEAESRRLNQSQFVHDFSQVPIHRGGLPKGESRNPNKTGLPDQLKAGIENLSGYSLNDVRVHYNSPKPAQLQALAYTQGTEIHVAPGQEKHLPHEAWHVVQQKQGRVKPTLQMKGKVNINDDAGLEKEADVMGAKAANMPVQEKDAQKLKAPIQSNNQESRYKTSKEDQAKTKQLKTNQTVVKLSGSPYVNITDRPKRKADGNGPVHQLANIIWSKDDPPVIVDIDFGERSGKQDDHFTAFTVFSTGVLQNLRGQTLQGAIIQLLLLTNEITEIPSYVTYRDKGLGNKVGELKTSLLQLLEGLMNEEVSPLYVNGQLGILIDDYLRIRNLVPGTKIDSSEAIRPPGYRGGGKLEKEGKAELLKSGSELERGSDFSIVEEKIANALHKLHDYISNRTKYPEVAEFVMLVAQHFISIMQAMPALVPHAEEVLAIWMSQVFDRWREILRLEWSSFAREVIGLTSQYVRSVGVSEERELGPIRLDLSDEELMRLKNNGTLPHDVYMIFIKTRARVFILNNSIRLVITAYSGDNIKFRLGLLGG
jgi:hypothetical protein